jgi:hypothetical protein
MALSSTIQSITKPVTASPKNDLVDPLLGMALLTALAASGSRKALRKLKARLFWSGLKLKFKHLFSKDSLPTKTIIYILLGVVLLALLFINPLLTLILAVVALVVLLTTKSFS